jgi:hypothetical protein
MCDGCSWTAGVPSYINAEIMKATLNEMHLWFSLRAGSFNFFYFLLRSEYIMLYFTYCLLPNQI